MTTPDTKPGLLQHPAVPYIAPFIGFLALLAARPVLAPLGRYQEPVRFLLVLALIAIFARPVLRWQPRNVLGSIAVGVLVFVIWILPDTLIPGYRTSFLFSNSIVGQAQTHLAPEWRSDWLVLIFRSAIATLLVPILEELFWRGWLLRWLIDQDFEKIAIGTMRWSAVLIASALFAAEHGSYWDVGFAAGLIYNLWVVRTKSLTDCILAHAVTNGVLCWWIITQGQWQYWL